MGKTNTFENDILKLALGMPTSTSYPITPFLVLFTTMPADDGTGGVEVSTSGTGYAPQSLAGKFPTPAGAGTVSNNADIDFGIASSAWGTILGAGIRTAASGGVLLRFAPLSPAITVSANQPVSIPTGFFTIGED